MSGHRQTHPEDLYTPPIGGRGRQRLLLDNYGERYQRESWIALKQGINGLLNKVNRSNIRHVVAELLDENLIRGRGLLVSAILEILRLSTTFVPVFSSLVASLNSWIPDIGHLLSRRVVFLFKSAYDRRDKQSCGIFLSFIAHLVNHGVIDTGLTFGVLEFLIGNGSLDSIEMVSLVLRGNGHKLEEEDCDGLDRVFDMLRVHLVGKGADKRHQWTIQDLFEQRRSGFEKPSADLVEVRNQTTHKISLNDVLDPEFHLDVFQFDPFFREKEEEYKGFRKRIVVDDDVTEERTGTCEVVDKMSVDENVMKREVYLCIVSSLDFEECCHKIQRLRIPHSFGRSVCRMIVDCCRQERVYTKFYGLVAERLSNVSIRWRKCLEEIFLEVYEGIHQYETVQIKHIGGLFGHLLVTLSIGWDVLSCIRLTERDTTPAGRIFVKVLFELFVQEYGESGLLGVLRRGKLHEKLEGLFPMGRGQDILFAINYYTAIGLGFLTTEMRGRLFHLENGRASYIQTRPDRT